MPDARNWSSQKSSIEFDDVGDLLVGVALWVQRSARLGRAASQAAQTGDPATATAEDPAEQQEQDDDHDDGPDPAAGLAARDRDGDPAAASAAPAAEYVAQAATAALATPILDPTEAGVSLPFHDVLDTPRRKCR